MQDLLVGRGSATKAEACQADSRLHAGASICSRVSAVSMGTEALTGWVC